MRIPAPDPRYPPVCLPAGAFGRRERAVPQASLAVLPVTGPTDRLLLDCPEPIHHVLTYTALFQHLEAIRAQAADAHISLRLRSALDDEAPFAALPLDAVQRLPVHGPPVPPPPAAQHLPPLGFAPAWPESAACAQASRRFQRAVTAASPRWTCKPEAPWPIVLPTPKPRFLLHQARFHVGDTLWMTPLLAALSRCFPRGRVTVVGPPVAAQIFADQPAVDNILPYLPTDGTAGKRRVLDALAPTRFDAALFAFARRPESRWLATAAANAGIPHRINLEYIDPALDPNDADLATHEGWCFWNALASPHMMHQLLAPFDAGVTDDPDDLRPRFTVSETARQQARARLVACGVGDAPYAVLAPGGHSSRRWPAARFAALASALASEHGLHVLIEGAAAELPHLRAVAAASHAAKVHAAADPLDTFVALLTKARLLVANNSAPIHLAAATGTPTLYFAERQKLVHAHPQSAVCWSLFDEVANDLTAISVDQALSASRALQAQQSEIVGC